MPSKPRILYIVSTFPRKAGEMQNPWMVDTIQKLKSRGYEIDVLAPAFRGLENQEWDGIRVFRWRYFLKAFETLTHDEGASNKIRTNPFLQLLFFPYLFFGILAARKQVLEVKYDFIHCHWPFPHGLMGWFARRTADTPKPKLVLSFYGASLLLARKFKVVTPILKFVIKESDGVVSISNFTAKTVNAVQATPQTIIPFGTPLEHDPIPLPEMKENGEKQILTVGRLIERKGVDYLIQAMPEILKQHKTRLHIIGSGDPRILNHLKKTATKLKVENQVSFGGKISNAELISRYKECDVFVLPATIDSRGDTEGLGVVLLEAMNYGRPVVGSSVGGITDIIKHEKSGLLTREKDPADLAEKILKILGNREFAKTLADGGCLFAKTEFDWERIIDKWEAFYKNV